MSPLFFSSLLLLLPAMAGALEMSACDCWNRECGYCADLSCAVKFDLAHSSEGVTVTSTIEKKDLTSILLFNGAGNALGMFGFSLSEIHLTGCISCNAPPAVRQAKRAAQKGDGPRHWTVRFDGGVIRLLIAGEEVFSQELIGECADAYKDIQYFSFFESNSCKETFSLTDAMTAGENINETCGGTCPEN